MGKNIDELLNDEQTEDLNPKIEPEQEAAPAEESTGPVRDEHGRFAKKEETGVAAEPAQETSEAPPAPRQELPQDVYEPLKAIRNENKELKAQLEQMQAFMAQQSQQRQPKEPDPDFWDDPQAFIQRQFQQFGPQLMSQWQQQQQIQRIDQSEQAFRASHPDFDEKLAAFREATQANPRLAQEMMQAPDPAEFAYSRGKTALELQRYGSVDQLLAAERAKWEQEAKAALNPHAPSLPNSTASDSSVGARTGPAWSGPKPLGELLG